MIEQPQLCHKAVSTIGEPLADRLQRDVIVRAAGEDRHETGEETWRALVLLTTLQQFENGWRSYDASGYKRLAITPSRRRTVTGSR
jgi:hypothetical protein